METFIEDKFLNESVDKILRLATLTLYGVNVRCDVRMVIGDVRDYLVLIKAGNFHANLRAFKSALTAVIDRTHQSLPDYKKTIDYALSLVATSSTYSRVTSSQMNI